MLAGFYILIKGNKQVEWCIDNHPENLMAKFVKSFDGDLPEFEEKAEDKKSELRTRYRNARMKGSITTIREI